MREQEPDPLSAAESQAAIEELEAIDRADEATRVQMAAEYERVVAELWPQGVDLPGACNRMFGDCHYPAWQLARLASHVAMRFNASAQGFEQGDRLELLHSLELAADLGVPAPAWCRQPLKAAVHAYTQADTATLDEAFGIARASGTYLATARFKAKFFGEAITIMTANQQKRLREGTGKPHVSEPDFEEAGRQLHRSSRDMREWWKEFMRDINPDT